MTRYLIISILIFGFSSVAYAAPRTSLGIPYGAIQSGYFSGITGETVAILPPPGWNSAVKTALSATFPTTVAPTVGISGVSRRVIGVTSRALPYVGLALTAYMLYKDIRDAANNDPADYPNLAAATTKLDSLDASSTNFNDINKLSVGSYITNSPNKYKISSYSVDPIVLAPNLYPNGFHEGMIDYNYGGNGTYFHSFYNVTNSSTGAAVHYTIYAPVTTDTIPTVPTTDPELGSKISGTDPNVPLTDGTNVSPLYQPEIDKMLKGGDDSATSPDDYTKMRDLAQKSLNDYSAQQQAAADAAQSASTASAQTAANTAQSASTAANNRRDVAATNYANNPTDGNKAALDAATAAAEAAATAAAAAQATASAAAAAQAATDAARAQEAALAPPSVPPDNTYDTSITSPAKKDIPSLLSSFFGSSPLVAMVRSFTISTSDSTCTVPIGIVYGLTLSFDFCRWESTLRACGGVLLIIMHGFAVLIVVRGW